MFPLDKAKFVDSALESSARTLASFAQRMLREAGEDAPPEVIARVREIRGVESVLLDLRQRLRSF